jgi:hypothetical protein
MKKAHEVYPRLYHYTNQKGLDGILTSQSLWAKNYKYLNDEREILLFMEERLPKFLYPYIEKTYLERIFKEPDITDYFFKSKVSFEEVSKHDVGIIGPSLFKPLQDQIYICSFSGEDKNQNINNHGLLSQWRAYGLDGGYCIIFDTKKIEDLMHKEIKKNKFAYIGLGDIVYSDDEKKYEEEFEKYLKEIASFSTLMAKSIGRGTFKVSRNSDPLTAFISCITRYKHFGFKEENEVRLVCVPDLARVEKKIFTKNGVDYVDTFKNLEENLPIEKIIVGPHKDKINRAEELRKKLENTNIVVSISDIPYVGNHTNC